MVRTVGVEEELLLVDEQSGDPRALSTAVLALAERRAEGESAFEQELHRQQLEFATEPRADMRELADEILRWRAEAARRAAEAGERLPRSPPPRCPSARPSARANGIAGWPTSSG